MRGTLLRGSKMCQRPPIQASNHAAKSPDGERRRRSDIAQIAGAVARRNIHAAAEGDGEMRVVAADAGPFVESLRGAAGGAGVLVVEGNMVMNVIADCLHARVAWSRAAEELPGRLRQQIGLAIAAAQQEHEGFFGQILHASPARRRTQSHLAGRYP